MQQDTRAPFLKDKSTAKIFKAKIEEFEALIREEHAYRSRQYQKIVVAPISEHWAYEYLVQKSNERLEQLEHHKRRFTFYYNTALGRPPKGEIDIDALKQIDPTLLLGKPIHKTQKSMLFLCPIHQEKTPSFHWYIKSNSFHCFGCAKGGDIIDLFRFLHNVDFLTACKELSSCG